MASSSNSNRIATAWNITASVRILKGISRASKLRTVGESTPVISNMPAGSLKSAGILYVSILGQMCRFLLADLEGVALKSDLLTKPRGPRTAYSAPDMFDNMLSR
eukprot:CAMPEP_0198730514 /NCGR_PEP_ID=MMETSP1475-20131203/24847_1 /TAXON_ID= ORGANISM="Unidentified sp., Strain CCMP1999" /NCGR_SAMPLE_ID=MMETSP1475 /ASSEMBLY_ACC=CAM_ASM_001111 /LENGTH=104 /DNA_ID=CAMNT_0044493325 /DNA_START=272 /DNA_END=583 /DNA_ORIENTATION=+